MTDDKLESLYHMAQGCGKANFMIAAKAFVSEMSALESRVETRGDSRVLAERKPVAWVRYRSDGGFEGPIMDSDARMCDTLRSFWTPLYAALRPAARLANQRILHLAHENGVIADKRAVAFYEAIIAELSK